VPRERAVDGDLARAGDLPAHARVQPRRRWRPRRARPAGGLTARRGLSSRWAAGHDRRTPLAWAPGPPRRPAAPGPGAIERRRMLGMASFAQDFKTFVTRGNVLDLAVAVVIGAAFGRIVSSFVADVLMPPIGLLLGGVDFSWIAITLKAAVDGRPPVTVNLGKFIQTIVDFLIVALAIFLVVRGVSRLRRAPPATGAPGGGTVHVAPTPAPSGG